MIVGSLRHSNLQSSILRPVFVVARSLHHAVHFFAVSIRALAIERRGKRLNVHPRQVQYFWGVGFCFFLCREAVKVAKENVVVIGHIDYHYERLALLHELDDNAHLMAHRHNRVCSPGLFQWPNLCPGNHSNISLDTPPETGSISI